MNDIKINNYIIKLRQNNVQSYKFKKYLYKLNNLVGGHKYDYRIKKENDSILPYGTLDQIDENNYRLTLNDTGEQLLIEYQDGYPFKPLKINNIAVNPWRPVIKTKEVIEKYIKPTRVMVYCHAELIETNFMYDFIISKLNQNGYKNINDVAFFTVDPTNDIFDRGLIVRTNDASYKMDGFADEFVNAHLNEYHMVFLPDCDGAWYLNQKIKDDNEYLDKMIIIVQNVLKIVKPRHKIIAGKLWDIERIHKLVEQINLLDDVEICKLFIFNDEEMRYEAMFKSKYYIEIIKK